MCAFIAIASLTPLFQSVRLSEAEAQQVVRIIESFSRNLQWNLFSLIDVDSPSSGKSYKRKRGRGRHVSRVQEGAWTLG